MDRTSPSEGEDAGSIPAKSTRIGHLPPKFSQLLECSDLGLRNPVRSNGREDKGPLPCRDTGFNSSRGHRHVRPYREGRLCCAEMLRVSRFVFLKIEVRMGPYVY